MSRFKPGDLALTLIDRCGVPAMSQVELIELVHAGSPLRGLDGRESRFKKDVWRVNTPLLPEGDLVFLPNELMPLRGDFAPEQQKAKEAEPCL